MSTISPAYRPKLRGDVAYVGRIRDMGRVRLRVLRLERWYEDAYRELGRNGRPRSAITMPGHGKDRRPPNHGLKFPPEPLSPTEILRLLDACPNTKAGIRNRALFALLWRTGARVSEALDLRTHHVDFEARRVKIMNGKGSKTRTVGIDAGGLHELQPWLFERATLGVPSTAPLFCTIQRPGRGGLMHDAYVRAVLHALGRRVGIPKRVHPHGFRHTLACELIREGFGITDVQAQLGHSNVATTATYLKGLGADEAFEKVAERKWPGGIVNAA
jgi:integrase